MSAVASSPQGPESLEDRLAAVFSRHGLSPASEVVSDLLRAAHEWRGDKLKVRRWQEGFCQRCGKQVWRDGPDHRWTDQFGRDRCPADRDDGECQVAAWDDHEEQSWVAPQVTARAALFGKDADGRDVELVTQSVPQGGTWSEYFIEPQEVYTWLLTMRTG